MTPDVAAAEPRAGAAAPADAAPHADAAAPGLAPVRALPLGHEAVRELDSIARDVRPGRRFPAPWEQRYVAHMRRSAGPVRAALCLVPALTFIALAAWGEMLLAPPEALHDLVRGLGLALVVPVGLLTAFLQWRMPERAQTERVFFVAFVALVALIEVLRQVGAVHGMVLPPAFATCAMVGFVIIGRMSVREAAAALGLYTLVIIASDLFLQPQAARTTLEWLVEANFLAIVAIGSVFAETYARRAWAGSALLHMLALADTLTGLPNRRAFEQHCQLMAAQATRDGKPLLLALVDIDHFKRINDTFGHAAGDAVLAQMGSVLQRYARRPLDLAARVGGEEFALLLYDCNGACGAKRLEELRSHVAALQPAAGKSITVSIGALCAGPGLAPQAAMKQADEALYAAKAGGRNRVVIAAADAPKAAARR